MKAVALLATVMLLLASVGLVACGDDDDEGAATEATTTEEAAARVERRNGVDHATEVRMVEYAFEPRNFTEGRGDAIIATNDGEMPHNYTIPIAQLSGDVSPGFELTTGDVDPGSSGKLRLNVSVPGGTRHLGKGKWRVICTIPGHAEKGMRGTLTVE